MGLLSGMTGSMESLARSKGRSKSDAGLQQKLDNADAASMTGGDSASVMSERGESTSGNETNLDKDQGNVLMAIIQQRESHVPRPLPLGGGRCQPRLW